MDDLITIFIIVMFFVKIFGKSKKKKSGAAPKAAGKVSSGGFLEQLDSLSEKMQNRSEQNGNSAARPSSPSVQQSVPVRAAERKDELKARYGERLTKPGERANRAGSAEGFSRPLRPSEELTPGRTAGSIVFHSDEGMDVCDPELSHGESSLDMSGIPVFAAHKQNEPLFTAEDMVRGFVMSEIFTRPSENRWKR